MRPWVQLPGLNAMASADDYTQQLINLSPQGLAWPTESTSTWYLLLQAAAQELARVDARANELLNEIFPDTTNELLTDWERVAGLPDECSELGESTSIRRENLLAKLTWRGGATPQYFIDIGETLGFTITITEFDQFRVDINAVGDPLAGWEWEYAWQINSALNTVTTFKVGTDRAGDPLRSWGNDRIECFYNRIKPAHTILLFAYS